MQAKLAPLTPHPLPRDRHNGPASWQGGNALGQATFLPPFLLLLGEIKICVHQIFCRKFHSEWFLYKLFFDKIRIFLQRSALKLTYFPIPMHYNISKIAIFETLDPLLGKIELCILEVFDKISTLQQRSALKWTYFPIPTHYNISKLTIIGTLLPLLGEDRVMCCGSFLWEI